MARALNMKSFIRYENGLKTLNPRKLKSISDENFSIFSLQIRQALIYKNSKSPTLFLRNHLKMCQFLYVSLSIFYY